VRSEFGVDSQDAAWAAQHVVVGEMPMTLLNDPPCHQERLGLDQAIKRAVTMDPDLWRIDHPLLLELERDSVVDVVPGVLLVAEDLVHHAPRPLARRGDTRSVQIVGDGPPALALRDELFVELAEQRSELIPLLVAAGARVLLHQQVHTAERLLLDDGLVLPLVRFALVDNLSHVDQVLQRAIGVPPG